MKTIKAVVLDKYLDKIKYKSVENGIYKDLENKRFVITLFFKLEEDEDSQYPLEDILDKYVVNCTDHIIFDEENATLEVEIEDDNDENFKSLPVIQKIAGLVGKSIYTI